jgi:hypothetical protein
MPQIKDLPTLSTSSNLFNVIIPVGESAGSTFVTKKANLGDIFSQYGFTGSRGYTGSIGIGYVGSASTIPGYTGSVGTQGPQGYIGSSGGGGGYTGSTGVRGYTGSSGGGGGGITTTSTSVDRSMAYWVGTDSSTLYSAANVLLSTDNLALEVSTVRVGITIGDIYGYDNLVLGIGAMGAETTSSYSQYNTAIGHGTLAASSGATAFTESQKNTAVGYYALNNHVSSEYNGENTAVGYLALQGMQSGHDNTAIGSTALGVSLGTGNRNTAVGSHALESLTSSVDNIAIGYSAANNITSGLGQNIIIGNTSISSTSTAAGQIVIGYGLTGKGNNTAFIGGSSGAYNGANTTVWTNTSDERIKKNIVDNVVGLNAITQVRVRNFNYKSNEEMPLGLENVPLATGLDTTKTVTGVIAQEFQEVFPTSVSVNSNGVLSVNPDEMIWAMVNAIKELSAEVNKLKSAITP